MYLIWTWLLVGPMDADATEKHATSHGDDDSTPRMAELIVVLASLASLAGVGYLLVAESTHGRDVASAVVGILSVAASWITVHTAFMLRYARLYLPGQGDRLPPEPASSRPTLDFAYLAFTVGMTYQVSDTDLVTHEVRRTVLFQALVSFLLGAIILAMTINLVAGLMNLATDESTNHPPGTPLSSRNVTLFELESWADRACVPHRSCLASRPADSANSQVTHMKIKGCARSEYPPLSENSLLFAGVQSCLYKSVSEVAGRRRARRQYAPMRARRYR